MSFLNNMKKLLGILLCLCFPFFSFSQRSSWTPVLKIKVDKAIASSYAAENLSLDEYSVSLSSNKEDLQLENHLFNVYEGDLLKGYIYVNQAPSMKNVFDYFVAFDTNFKVIKTKVLIYREQHGRQIGTPRWLNQFKGLDLTARPTLGKEIDGISGATISATSMTKAVHNLLLALSSLSYND